MWWKEPVTKLKGVGPKKAADLLAVDVRTIGDLLEYFPRQEAYLDYSQLKKIRELATDGSSQIFKAEIYSVKEAYSPKVRNYTNVTVRDETGYATLFMFGASRYKAKKLFPGSTVLITGKVKPGRTTCTITDAFIQPLPDDGGEGGLGIIPTYPLSGALTQNNLRKWIKTALEMAEKELPESLPAKIVRNMSLPDRLSALKDIHFPSSWENLRRARKRFIFEELFMLQWGLLYYRRLHQDARSGIKHGVDGELLKKIIKALPFELTPQQKKAFQEISLDMQDVKPMHRILQGDVGSGKTVISALALAKAVENGYQSCIMAPTEILAAQHYETLVQYLEPFGIRIGLLVGGMRAKAKRELLENMELGLVDVVIGTHALLEDNVKFAKLSLVVTDEQHRFGVEQRAKLMNKSENTPDNLIMTATPIPRTLALTVYGDLDVSLMKGRPPGRKSVQTLCYTEERRKDVYAGLVRQVAQGRQAYVVCPLIEQSDNLEARSAENVYEELKATYLKNIPVALLHGRMKGAEKEAIMSAFASGEIKVLVSTTVIEVGVNVPNATLMVIENAERFGLAQLHQLRGRVGRGDLQSYCVLMAGTDAPESLARLQVLHDSEDGFYLAEEDLRLRGSGQLFGLRQHGLPDLKVADIIRDTETVVKARVMAQELLAEDPEQKQTEELLNLQFGDRFRMIFNV